MDLVQGPVAVITGAGGTTQRKGRMTAAGRYTSGRIAVAQLLASIDRLERRRTQGATFGDLAALSEALFLRGDLLGRLADHDRAEAISGEAIASAPRTARAFYLHARVAGRFLRLADAQAHLQDARAAGHPAKEIDAERAALLQAKGRFEEALALRERIAHAAPAIRTLGALASLLAEMGDWPAAERHYRAALDADSAPSPIACAELLFAWAEHARRRDELERAETILCELDELLPQHVPACGQRAELALVRDDLDLALALVRPLVDVSDDPQYRATYAEVLQARGEQRAAYGEARRAAAVYEALLARRPDAYTEPAAVFFMGVGHRPERALELATANWSLRDTPRSRGLLAKALAYAGHAAMCL